MSAEQPVVDKAEILIRARRFASLRAAERALAPSVRSPESLPWSEALQVIRPRLHQLRNRIEARESAAGPIPAPPSAEEAQRDATELLAVDACLDEYAQTLRRIADDISIQQFRASLPELARSQREEVIALLDLFIEDDQDFVPRVSLLDYLITLLCIAPQGGGWIQIADPPSLSLLTQRRALEAAASGREAEIVERFQQAGERLRAGESFETVVREMAAYKKSVARYLFAPDALRCVVSYNLLLREVRAEQMRQARAMDEKVDRETAPLAAQPPEPAPAAAPAGEGPAPALESGSVFESRGLAAIEEAIERQLARAEPAPGPAAEIVSRADLAKLGDPEGETFRRPGGDEREQLIRRVVALGVAVGQLAEIEAELAQLGLDPALLSGEWARELSDRVQKETNTLIANNGYDEARLLSNVQSQFLFSPLLAARKKEDGERRPSAEPGPAPAAQAGRALTGSSDVRDANRAEGRAPQEDRARERGRWRRWSLAAGLAAALAAAGFTYLPLDPRGVRTLSATQLSELSPLLVSGYRSHRGEGPLFIGTLSPRWQRLKPAAQDEAGEAIRARLAREGVREVMLFDDARSLQAHYLGERTRRPGARRP